MTGTKTLTELKTLTEHDVLTYAACYLNDLAADLQNKKRTKVLDPESCDVLIEKIDEQLREIYDAQEALEKEETRA